MKDRRLILGISGSIAAYKAAELASLLVKERAELTVVMTASARRFIQPLTFQTLTGRPVLTDEYLWGPEASVEHIRLAQAAEAALVAPATAHTIAKLALGLADDALGALFLALNCPLLIAPAMNQRMYEHEAVQENLEKLRARGAEIIAPDSGRLACGEEGIGRLAPPAEIIAALGRVLGR